MRRALLLEVVSSTTALYNAYDAALTLRPRVVKAMTGGTLSFLGDANAQCLEVWSRNQQKLRNAPESERHSVQLEQLQFDARRSLAFTSLASFWTGPVNHAWYNLLEAVMPQARSGASQVVAKVAASQLVANPFGYLPTFYLWTGAVLGRTLVETRDKATREYWSTLRATWAVLGTANVVMFAAVPVHYQATFMAVTSFIYQNVLSLLANRDRAAVRREKSSSVEPESDQKRS